MNAGCGSCVHANDTSAYNISARQYNNSRNSGCSIKVLRDVRTNELIPNFPTTALQVFQLAGKSQIFS
jgi:hypothetical protein